MSKVGYPPKNLPFKHNFASFQNSRKEGKLMFQVKWKITCKESNWY